VNSEGRLQRAHEAELLEWRFSTAPVSARGKARAPVSVSADTVSDTGNGCPRELPSRAGAPRSPFSKELEKEVALGVAAAARGGRDV
jgi:hypothetical protein